MGNEDPSSQEGANGPKELRDALARKEAQIASLQGDVATYKAAALQGVAHQAGYDPSSGVVKLVMEKFEADLTPEKLDPSAFTSFAKEIGVEPTPASTTPPTQTPPGQEGVQQQQAGEQQQQQQQAPPATQDPATAQTAQQVQQFQAPGEQLAAAAQASQQQINPSDVQSRIAKAEADGDWGTALALKVQSVPSIPDGFGGQNAGQQQQGGLPVHTPPAQ